MLCNVYHLLLKTQQKYSYDPYKSKIALIFWAALHIRGLWCALNNNCQRNLHFQSFLLFFENLILILIPKKKVFKISAFKSSFALIWTCTFIYFLKSVDPVPL